MAKTNKLSLNDVLILEESSDGLIKLNELIYEKDKDLGFLVFCKNEELQNLIRWIAYDPEDKKTRLREHIVSIDDFQEKFERCPRALLLSIVDEIQGFSTHMVIGQGKYRDALTKVCDYFKVNYHPLLDTDKLELELIKKLWDLGIDRLNETDIHRLSLDLTSSINKYCDGLFSTASYRVIIPCVLHIAYYRYRQKALHQSQYISEN